MHPYSYNINQIPRNMYPKNNYSRNYTYVTEADDRFIVGGALAPFLLGGLAGYAIGNNYPNNNNPRPFYNQPYFYPTYYPNTYYNNFYYYPY